MSKIDAEFKERVYALVAQIPQGRVMTYGQIAALCGEPRAAWEVGQIAHTGPTELPWQRVVNKQGGLAVGWPGGGQAAHRSFLEADGVAVGDDYRVDITNLQWQPGEK
jgi:methylated-DNA-protein-cysteine methyltransferase-like protein